jgi:hypothetical protein
MFPASTSNLPLLYKHLRESPEGAVAAKESRWRGYCKGDKGGGWNVTGTAIVILTVGTLSAHGEGDTSSANSASSSKMSYDAIEDVLDRSGG